MNRARQFLHRELLDLLELNEADPIRDTIDLYAVAYRTAESREDSARFDVWWEPLALGQALPTLPLWIEPSFAVPVELERAYQRMCQRLRIN